MDAHRKNALTDSVSCEDGPLIKVRCRKNKVGHYYHLRIHAEFEVQANDELPPIEADLEVCAKLNARFPGPESVTCKDLTVARLWAIEEPEELNHINQIEDPKFGSKTIRVSAIVASTSVAYLVPSEITIEHKDPEAKNKLTTTTLEITPEDPLNLEFTSIPSAAKYRRIQTLFDQTILSLKEKTRTVYKFRVRPEIIALKRQGTSIVDEAGFEYKAFDIYVATDKRIDFQASTKIEITGTIRPDPRNQRATLLGSKVDFPDSSGNYDKTKIIYLSQFFKAKTVKERLAWILDSFENYSGLVGRRNLAQAALLSFFTPLWIIRLHELQHGWGNILIIGDSTTGKSETIRKVIALLRSGMVISAETVSIVGLTGTATQLEREGWFVEWGFLPLNDKKLLAIDGAHKLSRDQWAALAEAERLGLVTIAKAAKSSAYARARQVKLANPVDVESGQYSFSTKALSEFLYPIQSVPTVLDAVNIARLDFAVFADQRDVAAEEVNKVITECSEADLELLGNLSDVLRWVWSGDAKLEFEETAWAKILTESTSLYNDFFVASIPLVSIDMKWKLARLSGALAAMTLSTKDYSSITVTTEHVTIIANIIRGEYRQVGLGVMAQSQRFETLTLVEIQDLKARIQSAANIAAIEVDRILEYLVLQLRVTKDQIKEKFSLADKSQLRPLLGCLQNEGLIKAGKGYYATAKLIIIYKGTHVATFDTNTTHRIRPPQEDPKDPNKLGSYSDDGNNGNRGNKLIPELLAKVGTWSYNHPAQGDDGWMIHADLRSALSPAEYEMLRINNLLETKDDATLVRLKH
jgi:predicted GTPase